MYNTCVHLKNTLSFEAIAVVITMLDKYIYSLKQYLVLPSEQKQCISLLFQTIENEIHSLENYVQLSQLRGE